jgi:hypothetical protein
MMLLQFLNFLFFFYWFICNAKCSDAIALSFESIAYTCSSMDGWLYETRIYSRKCASLQELLFDTCCAFPGSTLGPTKSPDAVRRSTLVPTKSPAVIATVPLYVPTIIPTDKPTHGSTISPTHLQQDGGTAAENNNDNDNHFNIMYGVIGVLSCFLVGAALISNRCACSHAQCQFITGVMTFRTERGQSTYRDLQTPG